MREFQEAAEKLAKIAEEFKGNKNLEKHILDYAEKLKEKKSD